MHDCYRLDPNPLVDPSSDFSLLRSKLFGKDEEGAVHALACISGMYV